MELTLTASLHRDGTTLAVYKLEAARNTIALRQLAEIAKKFDGFRKQADATDMSGERHYSGLLTLTTSANVEMLFVFNFKKVDIDARAGRGPILTMFAHDGSALRLGPLWDGQLNVLLRDQSQVADPNSVWCPWCKHEHSVHDLDSRGGNQCHKCYRPVRQTRFGQLIIDATFRCEGGHEWKKTSPTSAVCLQVDSVFKARERLDFAADAGVYPWWQHLGAAAVPA